MAGKIYKITNKVNGKSYVGQTVRPINLRWSRHKTDAFNRKSNLAIHLAMRKYGVENFTIDLIAECNSVEEMNEKECFFIREFNTISPHGYNLNSGGENAIPSEQTRQKISKAKKGKPSPHKGTKQPKEVVDKRRAMQIGKKLSSEHRQKLSEAHKKPIFCNENQTTYPSTKEAASALNLWPSNVHKVLIGEYKQTGGYSFSYI